MKRQRCQGIEALVDVADSSAYGAWKSLLIIGFLRH